MRSVLSNYRLRLRVLIALSLSVLIGIGFAFLLQLGQLGPFASRSGWSLALALIAALAIAALAGGLLLLPLRSVLFAVSDGLLSLREKDFGVRLVARRQDEAAELIKRFNALGEMLRAEHNDVYQKQILLETVLESAPMAVVLCHESGTIVLANGTARTLFGQGRRLEGHTFSELVSTTTAGMRAALESADDGLFTVEQDDRSETFHVAKRYFELSTLRHVLYLIKPLTRELLRQEAEIWKRSIRVISHELNNSLAPISSLVHSAKMLAGRPGEQQRLDTVFATIEERTRHLRDFIEGYARFARLPKPTPTSVEWKPFLARLQSLYDFSLPDPPPERPGFFDPAQVEQVLINLLKNAIESGGRRDQVSLTVRTVPDGIELEVADRGSGMTDEVMRKALLPFFSTKKTGTGLGLPLCREILESHGGRLSIARRTGGGMAITCFLPSAAPTH